MIAFILWKIFRKIVWIILILKSIYLLKLFDNDFSLVSLCDDV